MNTTPEPNPKISPTTTRDAIGPLAREAYRTDQLPSPELVDSAMRENHDGALVWEPRSESTTRHGKQKQTTTSFGGWHEARERVDVTFDRKLQAAHYVMKLG